MFLALPVALFLGASGFFGYFYIRGSLVKEWQETAVLRLERAAHQMDMRLHLVSQWMEAYATADNELIRQWAIQKLREHPGVTQAQVTWRQAPPGKQVEKMSPVTYFFPPGQETVGLRGQLLDKAGQSLGQIEVIISFKYLMQGILTTGWMQTQMACLVSEEGHYLAHSSPVMESRHCLGETQDPLELAMLKAMKEKPYATLVGGGYTPERVIGYYRLHAAPWAIMLHARGSQIMGPILRFRFYYLVGATLCLAVIMVLIRLGVGPMISSIRRISLKASQVARGDYGEPLPVSSRDEIGQLTQSFNDMVEGLKERDFISNTFGRYVDQEIARELLSRPEASRLGGEKRQVVILFSDIRGFTPLAERLSPEAIIHLINRHFSRMIAVIQAHRGIIVDFLGDAILAFFDPWDGPLAPTVERALQCAVIMQAAMEEENLSQPGAPALQMGIGVHAGEVVVGNIGSESRAKYGIIGAAVNLTHRIQAQARGREVVLSEEAYRLAPPGLAVARSYQTHLKGIQEPVTLYVLGDAADLP